MGAFHETIPERLFEWILAQKMFWIATAPLSGSGHINISPKGGSDFGVADNKTFWYMDFSGSGAETIAHIYEPGNGRATVMFNAFEGPPRILRLYGRGEVLECGTDAYRDFIKKHDVTTAPGSRSIILVHVHLVGTSCGFSVPFYEYKENRNTLNQYFEKKEAKYQAGNEKESMPRYWALNSSYSLDGLPGMQIAQKTMTQENIEPAKKMPGPHAQSRYSNAHRFGLEHLFLVALFSVLLTVLAMQFGTETARAVAFTLQADPNKRVHAPLNTMT